ncbi:sugar-binding transcriptional regulator [Arthrobacter luteolus]|uniref:sugar-binding transcriptional regulator n=1 Tax=Arthrobacter luteolus TaxID=98672 RepID=UPI00082E7A95|nr:sugar-binding domain-containing protein [Arthrobacter luteolus]
MHEDADLYRAAELYYIQGATMETVAEQFNVSRSTVSRMLQAARERGIVRITLSAPVDTRNELVRTLRKSFGVTTYLAAAPATASNAKRLKAAARHAAVLIHDWFTDGMTMAVAWGTTTSAVAAALQPKLTRDATVVQMNGAVSARSAQLTASPGLLTRMAASFDAALIQFPAPAFFDDERTRELMWQESTVRRVLAVRAEADLAVFSVGAFQGPSPSEVYSGGYLTEDAFREFATHRVVGDVCTVFLREDGSYADIGLNRRASGPTPQELRQIPRRLCVVSGDHKVPGLLAALRAGVITDLVLDDGTARTLTRHLSRGISPAAPPAGA